MYAPVILAEKDKNELLKLIIRELKNALTQNHFLNTHFRFTRNTGLSLGCTAGHGNGNGMANNKDTISCWIQGRIRYEKCV